jgi:hypothetical protein
MITEKKNKKKASPTQRSLAKLRSDGAYMCGVVEKWIKWGGPVVEPGQRTGNRVDLFGFVDVLAVMPGQVGTLGIQACAASSLSTRIRKVIDDPVLRQRAKWYEAAGNRLVFWGWKQNKKTKRWAVIERNFVDELYASKSAEAGSQAKMFDAPTPTEDDDHDPF